jgi:hypothetical protein
MNELSPSDARIVLWSGSRFRSTLDAEVTARPGARMRRVLLATLPLVVVLPHHVPAQSSVAPAASYRGRLLGVYDIARGEPLAGARVTDMVSHVAALTTPTGTVSLAFLSEGANLVRVERIGFQPATVSVRISPADTVPVMVLLQTLAHDLAAVVIRDSAPQYDTPALRRFEERRLSRATHGYFLSEADLQKHSESRMSEVVHFPGMMVQCSRRAAPRFTPGRDVPVGGNSCVAIGTRGSSCPVSVYRDGQPTSENNLEEMHVDEYAGVEFYPGGASVPVQFNRTARSCGALLFWTRER